MEVFTQLKKFDCFFINNLFQADLVLSACVGDWECVVKKGEFKEGDLCVYISIDSLLDTDLEVFRGFKYKEERYTRIKTKKIRGVLSQGLALPLSILSGKISESEMVEYLDVTQLLEIHKYISPEEAHLYDPKPWIKTEGDPGATHEAFPSFLPKTSELRIQDNTSHLLSKIQNRLIVVTRKEDGS